MKSNSSIFRALRDVFFCIQPSICLFLTLPGTVLSQNILDKAGNPTATPLVAFSLRQLSSAYTGKAIQVRRSSDNTLQDIGFTPAGDLDTVVLKSFVGNGDGYVNIWYDQSGNGLHAAQANIALQPTIMVAGSINRDNGKPSVYTYGGTGFLYYGPINQLNGSRQVTRMEVTRSRSDNFGIIEGLGRFQLDLQLFPKQVMVQFEDGNITIGRTVDTTTLLMSINSVRDDRASKLYVNTVLAGTNTTSLLTLFAPDTGFIGVRFDHSFDNAGPGAFSETILFNSVLSDADRQAINCNENSYYSLGLASCTTLPIIIHSFTGRRVNETSLLAWTTAMESNSDRFEVERSANGSTWTKIGQTAAAGNSNTILNYQFTDAAPLQNETGLYYRLKLVDKDGKNRYSGVVLIKPVENLTITPQLNRIVPNPFRGDIEIVCTVPASGVVEVQLQDTTGATLVRRSYTAIKGDNVFKLTAPDQLPGGTYLVRVVQEGAAVIGKVIKQ